MIERKRLLALDYYKKQHFTGSDAERNMRFMVERIVPEADGDSGSDGAPADPVFRATVWPEPYSYDATDPALFVTHEEPFSEDGLLALTDWMNTQSFISA